MAFSYVIKGETAGVGGFKKVFGTWSNTTGNTTGTITWGGSTQVYNIMGGGAISSTSNTTMTAAKITATGTMALTFVDSDAGWWWVEVQ